MQTIKKWFKRLGNRKLECRIWQKNLTVLQMYETTSMKGIHLSGERCWPEKLWKWVESVRQELKKKTKKQKTVHKHCTLVGTVVFHTAISEQFWKYGTCLMKLNKWMDTEWSGPGFSLLEWRSQTIKGRRLEWSMLKWIRIGDSRYEFTFHLIWKQMITYRNIRICVYTPVHIHTCISLFCQLRGPKSKGTPVAKSTAIIQVYSIFQ